MRMQWIPGLPFPPSSEGLGMRLDHTKLLVAGNFEAYKIIAKHLHARSAVLMSTSPGLGILVLWSCRYSCVRAKHIKILQSRPLLISHAHF